MARPKPLPSLPVCMAFERAQKMPKNDGNLTGNHFCKYKFRYTYKSREKRFFFLPVAGAFGSGDQLRCPEDPLPSGTPAGPPRSVWFSSLRAPSPHKPFTWRVSAVLMTELIRSCCKMKIQTSQLEGASQRSEKNGPNPKGSYKPASLIAENQIAIIFWRVWVSLSLAGDFVVTWRYVSPLYMNCRSIWRSSALVPSRMT